MSILAPTKKQNSQQKLPSNQKNTKNQKPKKKKNQAKRSGGVPQSVTMRQEHFYLSKCSRDYVKALLDPYNVQAGLACIPDLNDLPSWKTLVVHRGTFSVGTTGIGFVFVNPSAAGNTAVNWRRTSSLYTGAAVTVSIPTTGVDAGTIPQMPFLGTQLGDGGVLSRTVGCGIRIRYLGTELDRSGRLIPWRSNNVGSGVPTTGTTSNFLSQPQIPSIACVRKWHSVTYLPTSSILTNVNRDVYSYQGTASDNVSDATGALFDLGWVVDGAKPGNAFEYEVYFHKEYISADGRLTPSGVSASHSDLPGLSAVRNAVEADLGIGDGQELYRRVMEYMKQWTPADISHVGSYASALSGTAKQLGWL